MYLNCDLGESYGPWSKGADELVMPLIDWANVACGGHAGDPDTMAQTLALAVEHGVRPGAHPGYPDPRNFGRIRLDWPLGQLVREVQSQLGSLLALAAVEGIDLHHVKPHGALYNAMMADDSLLVALAEGVAAVDSTLVFVLQATPDRDRHLDALSHTGLSLAFEAFADRRYTPDGRLESRSIPGSVIMDSELLTAHVTNLVNGFVETARGPLPVQADTLCVHGDNPSAVEAVRRIRELIPRNPPTEP
jgi:UPF0271 protein